MEQSSNRLLGANRTAYVIPFLDTSPQNYCNYNLALLKYNQSLCNSVTGTLNTVCRSVFSTGTQINITANANSVTLQNVSTICSGQQSSIQLICVYALYTYVATQQDNVSICGMIPNGQYKYACYAALATKYKNSLFCNYISNLTVRSACEASLTNSTA